MGICCCCHSFKGIWPPSIAVAIEDAGADQKQHHEVDVNVGNTIRLRESRKYRELPPAFRKDKRVGCTMNFHVSTPEDQDERFQIALKGHPFVMARSQARMQQLKHPGAYPIDPALGTGGKGDLPPSQTAASPHLAPGDNGMTGTFYSEPSRNAMTPSSASNSLSVRSPSQPRQSLPPFTPHDRSLPSRNVSEETIDEAYAQFILYCNPSFPLTTDTTELKKIFRLPPKSDGKQFSTWHLYELVKKYEEKEIKTWVELALELGVEKPALERGQSTQKVQQYSVRLKRWMHAMHVDAFFDYLRESPKEYYTQIPHLHNPYPEEGRDGVPAEEDLAIRALDPSMRPKRGRRKAEEMEDETERAVTPDPKHPRMDGTIEFPSPNAFAVPSSAYSHDYGDADPWTAASAITPASLMPNKGLTPSSTHATSIFRWKIHGNMETTPITPHPLSAATPASAHPDSAWTEEPQSAITPRGKTRRRHGPMVSSAWSSNAGTNNGKLRGRPPSNRTVRDGPFSTFPAKPGAAANEAGKTPTSTTNPVYPPLTIPPNIPPATNNADSPIPLSTTSTQPPSSAKRERLSLQVPQRASGPVHLITPPTSGASGPAPPTVLVNGEERGGAIRESPGRGSSFGESSGDEQIEAALPTASGAAPIAQMRDPSFAQSEFQRANNTARPAVRNSNSKVRLSPETLKRALAHDLLRATLTGWRRKRLRGAEAKGLAAAMLARIGSQSTEQAATWLGLTEEMGLADANTVKFHGEGKRISVTRFRVGEDGYDSPIDDDEDGDADGDDDGDVDVQAKKVAKRRVKESFDVSWTVSMGGLSGEFHVKDLVITGSDGGDGGKGGGISAHQDDVEGISDWKERYFQAQLELRSKDEEVRKLREKVLDAVL